MSGGLPARLRRLRLRARAVLLFEQLWPALWPPLGVAGLADGLPRLVWAGAGLALGACLFSADLASRAFLDDRLFPMAAPTGGSLMILSWLALAGLCAFARPGDRAA